jgi:glycine/D-amino acid oxidase-like deaminating enzyme
LSDVVVIGAGAFGAWTAHHLGKAGATVTLVDAYGPGNSRSSSGDESRILRCGYGPDEIYSRFARRSRELWQEFQSQHDSTLPFWHPCGMLWTATSDDAYLEKTLATLEQGKYSVERLDRSALRSRYPQLDPGEVVRAMLEPDAGVLMARRSIQALAAGLSRSGMRVIRGRATTGSAGGRLSSIRLADGTSLSADRYVFACGAWLPAVFPEALGQRITPTRQVVMYFGTPPGDERFSGARMPAWIDFGTGMYTIPDLEGRGVKVGIDAHGARFDPDKGDRTLDTDSIDTARAWLRRRIPALADAPLVESRVCQYENTSNGDFLIDRHPDHENAWIVGGGSGHGFKHGPAVGEYAARLVMTGAEAEPRFALASKGTVASRAIY